MPAQLRLLLWKDYLVRRRKLITLAGVIWATAVMLSLYIVRANVDNQDFPTCQFAARALPSAGMLSFLQSFLCGVNNECSPLDQYEEIPSYENSKLTQLQRQFSPLLYNETVLDVAATFPDALKLLSKLADIVDEPTFLDISKNGLRIRDLFVNPTRVKRYLSSRLGVDDDVMQSVMWSELSFQGILNGKTNRCSVSLMSQTLTVKNAQHLEVLVEKLCSLSDKELQKIIMNLLVEVNFSKYIKMVGNMFSKLNGDDRITSLGAMVTAVLRMTRLQSFLPPEVGALIGGEEEFSYFHLEMIDKLMDLFEPTFGATEAFKAIREMADTAVAGLKYMDKLFAKSPNATEAVITEVGINKETKTPVVALNNVAVLLEEASKNATVDVFNILSKLTNFIFKWLPANIKHDAMFYSTLLTKLIEGANNLVNINMQIEERTYDISLRHPGGVKILLGLPGKIIAKGFEGLADAQRVQIVTAKITTPGQVFCDTNRLQGFLQISKDEATSLKNQLCTDQWKSYIYDLVRSFGIFDVKDNINAIASLFIQETLGKDTSDQLYTIDHDFQVLKNFTQTLSRMTSRDPMKIDWIKLFNVSEDSEFMKTIRDKGHLGKQMLITVHGALAKEVVKQNAILSYKISPGLVHTTILVTAINKQLSLVPEGLTKRVRKVYPEVLRTVVATLMDEEKTYKSLSTHSEDIICNGVGNASIYLEFPQNVDIENLQATLCDMTQTIEAGFKIDSAIGKALEAIRKSNIGNVDWTALISGLKSMYMTLEKEYPYLFQYASYGMDEGTRVAVGKMVEDAKEFWFGNGRLERSLHLSVKMGFRLLDLLDRPIFNFTDESWSKLKYALGALTGPVTVLDDFLQVVAGISLNRTHTSNLPPATVAALRQIIPNLPQLIADTTDIVIRGDTDLAPIIAILNADNLWPCSTSMAEAVHLTSGSADALMALESIMCMDDLMMQEWETYLAERNVTMFNMKKWNTTTFGPHVFLEFSAAFDALVEDGQIAKQVVQDMAKGTEAGVTWPYAVEHLLGIFNRTDRDAILSKFFASVDAVLSSVSIPSNPEAPLNALWTAYAQCGASASCSISGRVAFARSLQFLSVMLENVAADLFTYFKENNEPNANVLQLMGFTKNTPLFEMYEKLPDFMGVLLNSYFDYGFMTQIRRASLSQFWDCEAILAAMVPPPGSIIDLPTIKRVRPYVCPSFLYWLSLPRGDNILLDVISKPQYFFYTLQAENLTSSYENAYNNFINLTTLLTEIKNKTKTLLTDEDIKLNSLEGKLENLVDKMLNYKINETDIAYRLFNEINTKQFASTIYLTRVVVILNKLSESLEDLQINEATDASEEELKKTKEDLIAIQKLFKRRRTEITALHFDVITDVVWTNNDEYNLTAALKSMCEDFKNNVTIKDVLVENQRLKNQICSKRYDMILKWINLDITDDLHNARGSLLNLVTILRNGEDGNVTDVFKFLNDRKQLITVLRTSIKYAYDLNMSTYLQYLRSTLQHYDVILTFLAGGDWWKALRELYRGPIAGQFLDSVENSFDVVENVLTNLDEIHLVRLMHDINVNNTDLFCMENVTLADYLPDRSGALSQLKRQMCSDNGPLLAELPPLLFASLVYDSSLQLPKEINYTALNLEISKTESMLHDLKDGPMAPQRPLWVTDQKIAHLREVALRLLSKESLTRMSFGLLSNLVDAGTLFLNSSNCPQCSYLTSWLKQLNLQVFKKQEYDNLLCHLHDLSLEDVHYTLKNDFHWDMAIQELLSVRNYTKYELNKSLNEFLELVKLHLLEDVLANSTKLSNCLARNVTRNILGNATLFITVLSHTTRLLRAEAPYLHEIEGITSLPYFVHLSAEIAPRLDVTAGLKGYLAGDMYRKELRNMMEEDLVRAIEDGEVNLRLIGDNNTPVEQVLKIQKYTWEEICKTQDCKAILRVINENVNKTLIAKQLPALQTQEFFRFTFVSKVLRHVERLLGHVSRLMAVASRAQLQGVAEGQLAPTMDFLLQVLMEDTMGDILYSIHGVVTELRPLLTNTTLEEDILALARGLGVMQQLKNYVIEHDDLRVEVGRYFSNADGVEHGLSRLGLNNTNFWSVAAPRLHAGHIQLKPLFQPQEDFHLSNFVCQLEQMSQVFEPADLGVVTAEDVFGAIAEQFCSLPDDTAKQVVPVLLANLNFSAVLEKVASALLPQLYSASNLTLEQGTRILDKYPQMAALLPTLQSSVGELGETVAQDPLLQTLRNFSSVGGLLGSSSFLAQAGNMMCGKPFVTDTSRFIKAIAESEDFTTEVDQAQLDVLPTDFCRSLYRDIVNMNGGKIVWSFVKPLLMGRILYTPANSMVNKIIHQANATFAHMSKLTQLVHSFADSFPSVDGLSVHREGLSALRRIISSPAFAGLRGTLVGDGDVPDVDVDGLFDEFGDLQGIGSILKKGSDLLRCINLNRFSPVADEYQLSHEAVKLSRVDEFSAGLVFLNTENQPSTPLNVEYKIRMDIENTPTTARKKNYLWIPGPESSFLEHMRYFRGFVQLQDMVDNAIIQLSRSKTRRKRETEDEAKWAVYTQQIPYPCYRKDFFQTSLYESQALLVAFFFSLVFTVSSAVRFIVSDKETGNTMLMSVMGVKLRWQSLSWFLVSLAEMVLTGCCMVAVLSLSDVLPHTPGTLLLALVLDFGVAVLAFCYMMSKLFKSASLAAVCTAIVYLMTFMPFVIILSLEAVLSLALKLLVCLSMSSAICYAFLYIAQLEAMGTGAQWADLWASPDGDMSIGLAALMVLVDAAIYLAIGLLLDKFFGPKTLQSNITHCQSSGEKAGVSIVNVSKVYGEGSKAPKLALDNVSIELHKGQITTLLGHNGAGKTTLINILTGMLKPSKGHVVIRSDEPLGACLGVCPQQDVLFEQLSASEHVALYAQLKSGLPYHRVKDEVDSMLLVLSLGAVSREPVWRLSGGTRRRLCVALAFVAEPKLVTLDEPTAGVDPAARRDIWSMIVKLRAGRTILMTTHHLDEAELLSDQIVIMHKGQVHTTGSPIEIKRTLGNGYKLSVVFPDKTTLEEPWLEDFSMEERTKQLLTVVRQDIRNATLVDVNGTEVEIVLPFFDADGVNNDFHRLCSGLETRQEQLGFRSFSLDCSSLEQVFFNICQQVDKPPNGIEYEPETPSKSASTVSVRSEMAPLVPAEGPLRGTPGAQLIALLKARFLHYARDRWLMFLLIVLPSLFVATAMAFSMIRPPPDNEVALRLHPALYGESTDFLVSRPSLYSDIDPTLAQRAMDALQYGQQARNWTSKDTPTCKCTDTKQDCDQNGIVNMPKLMVLPDVTTLNNWLVASQEAYIEKRYGGYSSSIKNNITYLVAWYNNKGHHSLPSYLNALNSALLRAVSGDVTAAITVHSHPLKISREQLSKDTVYQHVADAGISALVLLAYCLVAGGGAVFVVRARTQHEKRLQLLCGVSPALYWAAALAADMAIIIINLVISVIVFEAFGFPVFVARNNLPAICILILLYGFASSSLVHVCEKLFSEASMANMLMFCGTAFAGLFGITLLLILDIISDSDETSNARWVLHKVFMLCPQFVLGDGLLEIAKNTIQAQVLDRFGMDTYRDPLGSDLVALHFVALVLVGLFLWALNLAIEYDCFQGILDRFRSETISEEPSGEMEDLEVAAERKRVQESIARAAEGPVRLPTIGNINAGFVDTEVQKNSIRRVVSPPRDVMQCSALRKSFPGLSGRRVAVRDLSIGVPPGQCTALLGQNGAGKSTTFAMLTGELRPSSGSVHLGERLAGPGQLCQGLISYCPQRDAIDPLLTVRETLQLYCRLRGLDHHDEVIKRALEMFGLSRYEHVLGGALSGGNKRKLCTALAFMGRTPLVLLDEPTSGMDPVSRQCVSAGAALALRQSRGVVVSTHALADARRLAARVALMRDGRLCALASLDDCLTRFGGGYVVGCRCRGAPSSLWRRVRTHAPHARLRALHHASLLFLLPTHATVNKKEVRTSLSDIFALMASLQTASDIEDYTINQSSLDQMFLSFSERGEDAEEPVDLKELPTELALRRNSEELNSITSL